MDFVDGDDKELFDALKDGREVAFEKIYDLYRNEFLRISKSKYKNLPETDIIDAWQDSVISFYQQIHSGRLTNLTCRIQSYLFMMGFRYISKYYRSHNKNSAILKEIEKFHINDSEIDRIQFEERETSILEEIVELPEQSRKIIMLRYVEGKSITEIMKVMDYQSANAVSVSISRAIKAIKEKIHLLKND